MKQKVKKTNVMRILDKAAIPYAVHTYSWEEKATHVVDAITAPNICKTIVLEDNDSNFYVAVIGANQHIDLKKLASELAIKRVELLDLDKLEATTGYIRGGCSPIGMKKAFPTVIDQEAIQDKITISAGKRGVQVTLETAQLIQLVNASVGDIEVRTEDDKPQDSYLSYQ